MNSRHYDSDIGVVRRNLLDSQLILLGCSLNRRSVMRIVYQNLKKLWKEYKNCKRDSSWTSNVQNFQKLQRRLTSKERKLKISKSAKFTFSKVNKRVSRSRIWRFCLLYSGWHAQLYFAGPCLVHDLTFHASRLTIFGVFVRESSPKVTIIISTAVILKRRRNFVVGFKRNNFWS